MDEEDVYVTALEEFKDEPAQDTEEQKEQKAEVKNLEVKTPLMKSLKRARNLLRDS